MAGSKCVIPLRGSAMRLITVDNCGRPAYGTCSAFNTKSIRSLNFSADSDDGDAVEINTFSGDRCVYEPPDPQYNGSELEVTFCRYDPLLISRMTGCEPVRDEDGIAVGHVTCEQPGTGGVGMAMVVWHSIYLGNEESCRGGQQRASNWLIRVVPWTTRWIPGDLELSEGGEDGVSITMTGHTRPGVITNLPALVGGPVEPLQIPSGRKHDLWAVTSVPPPRDECGCVEVIRPVPTPAEINVQRDAGSTMRAQVWVDNHGYGPVTLSCGNGQTRELAEYETTLCEWDTSGTYTITACDVQTPAVCAQRDVTVPLPPDEPELTVTVDESVSSGRGVLLAIDNHGNGAVDVAWGDGREQRVDDPDPARTIAHEYARDGIYQITVTDVDEPEVRKSSEVVSVPVAARPVYSITRGQGDTDIEIHGDDTNQPSGSRQRTFVVDFGDGSPKVSTRLASADIVEHSYESLGTYRVVVYDMASPLARDARDVSLPVPGDRPGRPGQPQLTWQPEDQPQPAGQPTVSWRPVDQPDAPGQPTLAWEQAQQTTRTRRS